MLSPTTPTFNPVGFNFSSITSIPTCSSLSLHPSGALGAHGWDLPSLCGILGRLGFHGPYQIPCAGMSPRGNVWHTEGTGSSCAMTGRSLQLNTAMPQFIWIKNKSPVSHRASGTLSLERQNVFSGISSQTSLRIFPSCFLVSSEIWLNRADERDTPHEGGQSRAHL